MNRLVQFCHSCLHLHHQQSECNTENSLTITSLIYMFTYMHEKVRRIHLSFFFAGALQASS